MQSDRGAKSLQLCTCLVDQKIWAIWNQLSSMFTPASLAGAKRALPKKNPKQVNSDQFTSFVVAFFKLSIRNNFPKIGSFSSKDFNFHPNSMYNSLQACEISASDGFDPADVVASRGGFSFSSRNFNSARLMSTYQPSKRKKTFATSPTSSEFQNKRSERDENEWRWMWCPWTGFQWNR